MSVSSFLSEKSYLEKEESDSTKTRNSVGDFG